MEKKPIAVIGAGSWGTALALVLARNNNPVRLWGNEPAHMQRMQQDRVNEKYLPGHRFPDTITVCLELAEALQSVQDILIVVPSHAFRAVLTAIKPLVNESVRLIWGTKGLDPETCELLYQVAASVFCTQTPMAVLSGPSFAKEVAAEKPTAVSLAGNHQALLDDIQQRFAKPLFRVYENPDFIGVQLCGAVKNVLAIAVGIADGLELGANTRSAIITRGLAEMSRLCAALEGRPETLMSLAGVGDLVLTCTDDQSRNRRFGLAIGMGAKPEDAQKSIGQAVEGLSNAKQVFELAQRYQLEMPITEQVNGILFRGYSSEDVITQLLQRTPSKEILI